MRLLLAIMLGITSSAIAGPIGDPEERPRAGDDTRRDSRGDDHRRDRPLARDPARAPRRTTDDPRATDEALIEVRVESFGRPARIEVPSSNIACVTPCVLRLKRGAHDARVDGLTRTLHAGDGPIYVTPTRRARQALGITAV